MLSLCLFIKGAVCFSPNCKYNYVCFIPDTVNKTEDEDVYARGLANYGLQTQQQMRHLHSQIHEPIYVGYSPDGHSNSSIYGTASRSHSLGKKVPPKVPPKPSINALLGIGIVIPQNSNLGGSNTLPNTVPSHQHHRSNSTTEIYGTTKAANMRHISHV